MKIAILAHLHHPIGEPHLGGTEMHTAVVADELVRRGHAVTLFAKQGSRTAATLEPSMAADFHYLQMPGRDGQDRSESILVTAAIRAIESIRRQDFDVVLNNSLGPLPYTMLDEHPMLTVLHTPPTLEKVNAVITRPGWRPGPRHAYVSVSEFNTEAWRTVLPAVSCVPNGVYLDRWVDPGHAEEDLAVWSGRITPEKGLHLAIEAVRQTGMRLEFSGPVADRAYFHTMIEPELDDQIIYRGHLGHDALADLLGRGAVFVASSLWAEPFGLVMVESMACGTPVAAVPNGAAPEVVGLTGGAVARDCSAEGLAEAIKIGRDLDRARVRAGAQRFDARRMVERYETVMERLIESAPNP